MSQESKIFPKEKDGLHPRNKHRFRYDFKQLCKSSPDLKKFISINRYNNESIDFSNADAVKSLNQALLKYFYNILFWDIPESYLCPPIPGRADYIHYMADLLGSCNKGVIPIGKSIRVLDIGIGANCVYPIIGTREYGWSFVGSDIDLIAIESANKIIASNDLLKNTIECRLQKNSNIIFNGIIKSEEVFDISICNPPFHSTLIEAQAGTQRKWKNLGILKGSKNALNFGGQNSELCYNGGEEEFTRKTITQSAQIPLKCFWFSTLVSKSTLLPTIYKLLKQVDAYEVKTISMEQGQKVSRIVAWSFLNKAQQNDWKSKRWDSKSNSSQ